jgi:hypothetical protein
MTQTGKWWWIGAAPLVAAAFIIGFGLQGATTQGLRDAELRRQYQDLTEKRFDNDEQQAHDFRESTTHRLDIAEERIRRNSGNVEALNQISRDLHFLKRWIWLPFSGLLLLIWGAGRKCWSLGWKYGPPAWEWLMHLHECMDTTRAAVERNAQESAAWRAKTDRTLHKHGSFMMRFGLETAETEEETEDEQNSATV